MVTIPLFILCVLLIVVEATELRKESKWQTEEPTEDGLYAVKYYPYNDKSKEPAYCVFLRKDGEWIDYIEGKFNNNKTYAFAWQKINQFEEKEK